MKHSLLDKKYLSIRFLHCFLVSGALLTGTPVWASQNHSMSEFANMPINIVEEGVAPRVVINTSNDHQLYFKVYNDYSDLDGDGIPETTYKHSIDYYGYFDAYKCYVYDSGQERFEPDSETADKYCNAGADTGQWSGNFLNWVSMSRVDTIRKVLFGGHRRVDTATETVLERSYLPHDAHSWAKYYAGTDLPDLTPFTRADYDCDDGNTGDVKCETLGVLDRRKIGITFGNTSDVDMSLFNNKYSEDYAVPPLIKVVKGNYSLWASNERWQVTWASGSPTADNHGANNSNDPAASGIDAWGSSPNWSERLGEGNYVARVQVCVDGLIGEEKCKLYPGADPADTSDDIYKPVGLLQSYGDDEQMQFGMVAGSYNKHASGGVLVRNVGSLTNEVNVDTDGTFPLVAQYAGGPKTNNTADGLINAWSLYRIIGYDGSDGTYNSNSGDNCSWGLSDYSDITAPNRCRNWGNPFSEIYYQTINYFAGGGVIGDYRDNASNVIPGLPVPQPFADCLADDSYCADLFTINLNSSTSSYDYDELDHNSYGPSTIWDADVLPGDKSTSAMTDAVGKAEGIHGNSYYIGENDLGDGTDDQLCTAKEVDSLGSAGGICPESPRLGGSYRIAGLAYYAHVEDIRPDDATGSRGLEGKQTVDTYSVALATGVPVIEIPNPADLTGDSLVTLLPACRNSALNPDGNCALVDFKIVSQSVAANTASGTFYVNWEDSEQGGDYDQDMWGTLKYDLDLATKTVKITTQVHAQSTPYSLGFGYVISKTTDDGFHAHSGISGFKHSEAVSVDSGSLDCSDADGCNCNIADSGACNTGDSGASSKTYTLDIGGSSDDLLKDPLWYAAKYGGFIDSNDNKLPDLQSEWDKKINNTGKEGEDGIPDNYFYAADPQELEDSLTRVLNAILERTSSGTAAAVVASNVRGEGAMFQAYYEPRRKDVDSNEASWLGTVQALWLDSYGYTRQDCTYPRGYDEANDTCITPDPNDECEPDGKLDNYCVDQVVETYYDDLADRTRSRIYHSPDPDKFTSLGMQGVVTSYSADTGTVTMEPNSMEGMAAFSGSTLTLTPYEVKGTVVAYDADTGTVTMSIAAGGWTGPDAETFDTWNVSIDGGGPGTGYSLSSISLAANAAATFKVSPSGPWIDVGDPLILTTKNVLGATGQYFSQWTVTCLEGATASGTIGTSIQLGNSEDDSADVVTDSGDFSTCTRVRLATYNLRGEEGETYSSWEVSNLQTNLGHSTSDTELTLTNDGSLTFNVNQTGNWLSVGDQILVANYKTSTQELYQVGYLWNARKQLYLPGVDDLSLASNRIYAAQRADQGRYITTWVDSNLDNIVDVGEYRAFEAQMFSDPTSPVSHTFFDVASQGEAEDLVDYIRGIEQAGSRNRTVKYSPDDADTNVMRLGDVVNSTPIAVAAPAEAFDLLYRDPTYKTFRKQYKNRRIVVYAGSNDGLIHAFNGGFYTVADKDGNTLDQYGKVLDENCAVLGDRVTLGFVAEKVKYSTCGYNVATDPPTPAAQHPLGSELWAYAPMNLQPHLQWLKNAGYKDTHVSYVDAKPRVFDAKIFDADDEHPEGYGTILVVGMDLGGGKMTFDIDHDNDPATPAIETSRLSAYAVFDITNPEEEPELLGEITIPDESFTSVFPAVIAAQDVQGAQNCNGGADACNTWYLMFGTGPNSIDSYESNQNAKMYLFDLKQLITGFSSPVDGSQPAGCDVLSPPDTMAYNMISCDTGIANSFMGSPSVVDWELDFRGNTAYFGLVGDANSTSGRLMRFDLNNSGDPIDWTAPVTFYDAGKPIFSKPVIGLDDHRNHWVFFGSGRYFSLLDKTNKETQRLYGIKDFEDPVNYPYPVPANKLLNVTDAEVFSDGSLEIPINDLSLAQMNTFDDIETEIDTNAFGWFLNLPPIVGIDGSVPSTRNTTRSALAGGVLLSSVFQPSENPCSGEGLSRLYGVYYKTGTSYPIQPPIFDTTIKTVEGEVKYLNLRFVELGRGAASSPTLHSGSGSGSGSTTAFIDKTNSEMVKIEVNTVLKIRSGRTSWRDQP